MRRVAFPLLAALAACRPAPPGAPAPEGWAGITRYLDSLVADGVAPGAVLAVSLAGRHYVHGTGRLGQDDPRRPDARTIYDLASLTKVVGLTTAVMLAVTERRLALDQEAGSVIVDSVTHGITIRQLLTHSSGLPAWRPLHLETTSRTEAIALARSTALDTLPGGRYVYSDLGAIWLTALVEEAYGVRLDSFLQERVFGPLGLSDTRYLPPASWHDRIAPTENDPWRGRVLRGEVHDENASRLDGVSGHAGLFSSAHDLLTFADWLLETWQADGTVPDPAWHGGGSTDDSEQGRSSPGVPRLPLRSFTARQDLPPGSSRALGWDTPTPGGSGGSLLSAASFGHTGFTGTSIWIDPQRRLAIILLTNRVHPSRSNSRLAPVRGAIADRVVRSFTPVAAVP